MFKPLPIFTYLDVSVIVTLQKVWNCSGKQSSSEAPIEPQIACLQSHDWDDGRNPDGRAQVKSSDCRVRGKFPIALAQMLLQKWGTGAVKITTYVGRDPYLMKKIYF